MKLSNNLELFAETNGLRIKTSVGEQTTSETSRSVSQFLASIPSLKADAIFELDGNDLVATLENLLQLESREIDPLTYLIEWSPFVLKIEGKGTLGFDDFKFMPR